MSKNKTFYNFCSVIDVSDHKLHFSKYKINSDLEALYSSQHHIRHRQHLRYTTFLDYFVVS